VRRHLCGVLDNDDKKGAMGIPICPKVLVEQRRKYIQIEDAAQQKKKKQKTHSESSATSRFGSSSPHGTSATSRNRRTIRDFLSVTGRDDVDGNIVRFLCACDVPFNVLHSPCWHDMIKAINEALKGYKIPNYNKARTMLLEREKVKTQRALTCFTNERVDCGVSIVSDGWTNIRNQHLINVLGVSVSGAVFITCHDLLLQSIKDVCPNNVVQVITYNARNCKVAGKIIEHTHPHIFWFGCLVHILNLLMHDIMKHKKCGWINELYKRGKRLIKFITWHTRVNYLYGTCSKLQLLKLAKKKISKLLPHLQAVREVETSFN